jgi:hypothetical protein
MTLVYALVGAQSAGWTSARTLGLFALAFVLLATFVVIDLRQGAARALELSRVGSSG